MKLPIPSVPTERHTLEQAAKGFLCASILPQHFTYERLYLVTNCEGCPIAWPALQAQQMGHNCPAPGKIRLSSAEGALFRGEPTP